MAVGDLIRDLTDLEQGAEIELFQLSNYNPLSPYEFLAFSNCLGVVFQGISYVPIPCEIEGIEYKSEGALPRPKFRIADPNQLISGLILLHGGLEGAKITVLKTLKQFLDGQPTADPTAVKPVDQYLVSHRVKEIPGHEIEFELCSFIDFVNESLPGRPCITKCPWTYRGPECGYTGPFRNISGNPTTNKDKDRCGKRLTDCSKRFGKNTVLPFGGFVGLERI